MVFAVVLLLGMAQVAYCDTFTIDFETLPPLLLIVPISGLAFLRFFIDRAARKRSKDNFSQAPSHTHEQKLHWHETQQSRSQ